MPALPTSPPRRTRSRQQGAELIAAFRASRLSVKAFASQRGFHPQSLYYWLRQCGDEPSQELIKVPSASPECARGFIEIGPETIEPFQQSPVIIHLPNRIAIHLPSSASPQHVAAVVSALSRQASSC